MFSSTNKTLINSKLSLTKNYLTQRTILIKDKFFVNSQDTKIINENSLKKENLDLLSIFSDYSQIKKNNLSLSKNFITKNFFSYLPTHINSYALFSNFSKLSKKTYSQKNYRNININIFQGGKINLLKFSSKKFSQEYEEKEVLLSLEESLLMNDHDRICILLSSNSINKDNIINVFKELLEICRKLIKYHYSMQGWELVNKFFLQNLINFSNDEFTLFLEGLGEISFNQDFVNKVSENFLKRDFKPEDLIKNLIIFSRNNLSTNFWVELLNLVGKYEYFSESIPQEKNNGYSLNFSNSIIITNAILPNFILNYETNKEIKSFVDQLVNKFLAYISKDNLFISLSKKDIIIILRIFGHLSNWEEFKENKNFPKESMENFLKYVFDFISAMKNDSKKINLIIILFLMMNKINSLYENKNEENLINVFMLIAKDYKKADDLLKYEFYTEFIRVSMNYENINRKLKENSSMTVDGFYKIGTLYIPSEGIIKDFSYINEKISKENSAVNVTRIKSDFFEKYALEIGFNKETAKDFATNKYDLFMNLSNILG